MKPLDTLLDFAEKLIYQSTGEHFNDLQRLVLREAWQNPKKTYEQIATEHHYSGNYLQQVVAPRLWRSLSEILGEKVTKFNARSILERQLAAQTRSTGSQVPSVQESVAPLLEYPTESVPLESRFYVERSQQELLWYQSILQPGALLRIKGPRQIGKTSLVSRILNYAQAHDLRSILVNFQQVDQSILSDLNKLLRWFCICITQKLKLTSQLNIYWDDDIGNKMSCTLYMEGYLLESLNAPIVIALEEISELFGYPAIAQEFLTLLRTWHEQSKTDPTWQKLRLILIQSTESYIHLPVNQSPFNVGLEIALQPFNAEQVADLSDRHGLSLSIEQIHTLMQWLQGHPYLTRWTLYHLTQHCTTLTDILAKAATDSGIYHDHLHRHLRYLNQHPDLSIALQQVLNTIEPVELEQAQAFRLHSLGLVRLSSNQVTIACDLYQNYFRDRLT